MPDVVDQVREHIQSGSFHERWCGLNRPEPPASLACVEADEAAFGYPLPPLLKRLYQEIGNGGFGPGLGGLLGLRGGASDDDGDTAVEGYLVRREPDRGLWRRVLQMASRVDLLPLGNEPPDPSSRWPVGLLPICDWGCGIWSCIDCSEPEFPIVAFDPIVSVEDPDWSHAFFPECESFEQWMALWAQGENLWQRLNEMRPP
jgi:hypothetical protein